MRGDDRQVNALGEGGLDERRGPRHAAPRKSLLTKLHMPSGKKAFALAAMPTAVFVGMGLTPKLAMADDSTDIPFAPGPCVTRSDEPSESAEPSPSASKTPSPSASESSKPAPDKSDEATPEPTATPSASASATDEAKTDAAETSADAPAATASPSPTATKPHEPARPAGLGRQAQGLLRRTGRGDGEPVPQRHHGDPGALEVRHRGAHGEARRRARREGHGRGEGHGRQDRRRHPRRGGQGFYKPVKELEEDVKGLDPKADEDIPDGAKPAFPCPTADPKALAAADLEQGIPRLPNEPWVLESSLLTLVGLDYKGIVEVEKGDGSTKKVLKFTASSIDIKDLHQLTVGPMPGVTGHVKARKGSTSTIRDGEVTMYTDELKGNLFGLIPITFSPETPPPLNVPFAFFTNVKLKQAGQFGGTLKVPGLQNYFTKDGA